MFGEKLKTNLNTDYLKVVAIISMFIDHIGAVFFPEYIAFRCIGRIAFPIFCYCMTVGALYTTSMKNYILRLGLFALISQPFYVLAFFGNEFINNIFELNIMFTLLVSVIGLWGFIEKRIFIFVVSFLLLLFIDFDYGTTGIILMLIFYIFRNKPKLSLLILVLFYVVQAINISPYSIYSFEIFGFNLGISIFALFVIPFIYIKTNFGFRVPKMFFYIFYPAHLFLIFILRMFI